MGTSERPVKRGDVVWRPAPVAWESSPIGQYLQFLRDSEGLDFSRYDALHDWSVADLSSFWTSVWRFFGIESHTPFQPGLAEAAMPGAVWFPGSSINYAEHALRADRGGIAVIEHSQTRGRSELSWSQLRAAVATTRTALIRAGVQLGDTVAVYCPPIVEALIAYLACASIGAVYSSCAIEFGAQAVLSRLQQIQPKVLFSVDGYRYGASSIGRLDELSAIRREVKSLDHVVVIPYLYGGSDVPSWATTWADFNDVESDSLGFTPVPFDHPLVVVYSSGTTGPPKPIVHSHGGVLLEHLKSLGLQLGLDRAERFFWYTTTGWMMWNYLISGLLVGASVVLFDGDPSFPDAGVLWRVAKDEKITVFGVSPRFLQMTRRAGGGDMKAADTVHTVGSTGSPLGLEEYRWFYDDAGMTAALVSASGGTDVLSGLVGGCAIGPVYAGEISCPALGVDVDVVDANGRPTVEEQGELVVRQPMPSMPVRFWNDPDGSRLHDAYFAANPGLWTQGDWALKTANQTFVLTGRSDATLNRGGVRIGTAELYAVAEELPEIQESLAICLEATETHLDLLLLFVVVEPGVKFDQRLNDRLKAELRRQLSPRHVPDRVVAVPEIPRTTSGKKAELVVKRMLRRGEADQASVESPQVSDALAVLLGHLGTELRGLAGSSFTA